MRVIATETFVEYVVAPGRAHGNPSIAVAWVGGTVDDSAITAFKNTPEALKGAFHVTAWGLRDQDMPLFLDARLRDLGEPFPDDNVVRNKDLVDSLLTMNVVIEQSPPEWIQLQSLLQKSPHMVIGTYLGNQVATSHDFLLLATVPAGIVLIGTAIGLSTGLMNGLATWIRTLLK